MIMFGKSAGIMLNVERAALQVFCQRFPHFRLTYNDIRSLNRSRVHSRLRHIIWLLLREMTPLSTTQLGREYCRDHTTIVVCCQSVKKEIEEGKWLTGVLVSEIRSVLERGAFVGASPIPSSVELYRMMASIDISAPNSKQPLAIAVENEAEAALSLP